MKVANKFSPIENTQSGNMQIKSEMQGLMLGETVYLLDSK